jgi:NADH-quinone oxidoreductase subunit H
MDSFLTAQFLVSLAVILVVVHVILVTVAYLIYIERKVSAYMQDRIGPNRVGFDFGLPVLKKLFRGFGFWGLGQPLADGVKLMLKEDYAPKGVDLALFTLAPMAIIIPALIGWAVIPWGGYVTIPEFTLPLLGTIQSQRVLVAAADVNIGIVWLLAVASLGVYGVTLGGWASNSKYSFFGGLRASAGMISYEIPMGLSLLAVLLMAGTVRPQALIEMQANHGWFVVAQPLTAVVFLIAIMAEANRAPFDNSECEQELVGGYHTEYSSMRFGMFLLAEYANVLVSCTYLCVLFLGGYHLPFIPWTHPEVTGFRACAGTR